MSRNTWAMADFRSERRSERREIRGQPIRAVRLFPDVTAQRTEVTEWITELTAKVNAGLEDRERLREVETRRLSVFPNPDQQPSPIGTKTPWFASDEWATYPGDSPGAAIDASRTQRSGRPAPSEGEA